MAVVILDNVGLHYGEQVLLNGVNLTINERDRLCVWLVVMARANPP